jgi:putative transposase
MARLPRLSLPDYTYHVVQRGNNGQAVFRGSADYQEFLDVLGPCSLRAGVALHGYVLMENHFHLLLTPNSRESLGKLMQDLGRRYVRYFNRAQGRTGTLWEGRYRSAPLQVQTCLLACMAYLDLHPVRGGLVEKPQDYPWSSYGHYAGVVSDRYITAHAMVWNLGNTPFAREAAYSELVRRGVDVALQRALTNSVAHGWALGDANFLGDLQLKSSRRVVKASAGRPRKSGL